VAENFDNNLKPAIRKHLKLRKLGCHTSAVLFDNSCQKILVENLATVPKPRSQT
jgi:hypothetical protein